MTCLEKRTLGYILHHTIIQQCISVNWKICLATSGSSDKKNVHIALLTDLYNVHEPGVQQSLRSSNLTAYLQYATVVRLSDVKAKRIFMAKDSCHSGKTKYFGIQDSLVKQRRQKGGKLNRRLLQGLLWTAYSGTCWRIACDAVLLLSCDADKDTWL